MQLGSYFFDRSQLRLERGIREKFPIGHIAKAISLAALPPCPAARLRPARMIWFDLRHEDCGPHPAIPRLKYRVEKVPTSKQVLSKWSSFTKGREYRGVAVPRPNVRHTVVVIQMFGSFVTGTLAPWTFALEFSIRHFLQLRIEISNFLIKLTWLCPCLVNAHEIYIGNIAVP